MNFKTYLLVVLCFAFAKATAQEFSGIATYKSRQAIDMKMDSTKMNDEVQKSIIEQLKKQFEKEFTLKFTASESLYTENEKLDKPDVAPKGGIQIKISQSKAILYKNTKEKVFVNQDELMGKNFLIKDSLALPEWKLEKETKYIGEYMCFKATLAKEYTTTTWDSESNEEVEGETKEKIITVWYTPQIPVNNGPLEYWGLPGLILEVQDEKLSILCSSVVLNPKEKFSMEVPDKGKVVDQATYDKIQKEKTEEFMKRQNSGKSDGSSFTIKIGG